MPVTVVRNGKAVTLALVPRERPEETVPDFDIIYTSVTVDSAGAFPVIDAWLDGVS